MEGLIFMADVDGENILASVKKSCGIASDYTAFDTDIIMHINGVFAQLNQLGFGPVDSFRIETGDETWDDYYIDPRFDMVRSYMYAKIRYIFDPPTGSLQTALKELIDEYEWRLYMLAESKKTI